MPATIPALTSLPGRFVRLDPLGDDDLPDLFRAIARPEIFAGGYGGGPAGLPEDFAAFERFAARYYDRTHNRVFAVRLPDGELVGTSTLGDLDTANEHAHIGWTAYRPDVWGGPVNPEAKLLLLGHAFAHGFGRVRIQADAINERSRAAIEKLGARFEGVNRRDRRRADGSWRDTAVYSILIDEWPEVRDRLEQRLAAYA